ncbi:MAG: nucleotidyltransferase family protein [Prevotella sp.]|nr:nucleotidyltransferase family protein [Prevotella sp.]
MNIIRRNFFRLLRAGVFEQHEDIEPMSAWKWRQVLESARTLDVAPLLLDGIGQCSDQFFMHITDELQEEWQTISRQAEQQFQQKSSEVAELLEKLGMLQLRPILLEPWSTIGLYSHPSHHKVCTVSIFFPFTTQGQKADDWARANGTKADSTVKHLLRYQWQSLNVEHHHRMISLNNKLNNTALQHIIEREWLEGGTSHIILNDRRIETVAPTLTMLVCLLNIIKTALNDGLQLWQILDLGILLRQQGDRVDFVKLQNWIERLHIGRMTQYIGLVLTLLVGFSVEETPFMEAGTASADSLADELFNSTPRPGKFIRLYPGESIASVMASITHSLGNVEE